MKKHQKHTKLTRPKMGQWGRNEIAILGTTCGKIQAIAEKIAEQIGEEYKVCYIDASHKKEEEDLSFNSTFLNKVNSFQIETAGDLNEYQRKLTFNDYDLILVNGNHFTAAKQLVVIDPIKEASLERKLDRLTDVKMVLLTEQGKEVYPFLKSFVDDRTLFYKEKDETFISDLKKALAEKRPPLNGLVLAGGKSTRMGEDKGRLEYHGKPQKEHLFHLMNAVCSQVYVSEGEAFQKETFQKETFQKEEIQKEEIQKEEIQKALPVIQDKFHNLGPMGGILSAFQENPNAAWLTIACDLPLVNSKTLDHLITRRNPSKTATCFIKKDNINKETPFPDPLLTIWEPKSYLNLLQFLALGYSCPRKVLINSDVEIIECPNDDWLMNANDKNDYQRVLEMIKGV